MPEYSVMWEEQVSAESHEDALKIAKQAMADGELIPTVDEIKEYKEHTGEEFPIRKSKTYNLPLAGEPNNEDFQERAINTLCELVHTANAKWWKDLNTGEPIKRNVGEILMLCVSELAEALEGDRKDLMDDKLPHRKMFEVELADAIIRIFDIGGGMGLDLGGAFREKMEFNRVRADHKPENRVLTGGKKY